MNIEEVLKKKTGPPALSISTMGVVYGDIGTSPLYAMKETFFGTHPLARNPENILGILSLVFYIFIHLQHALQVEMREGLAVILLSRSLRKPSSYHEFV